MKTRQLILAMAAMLAAGAASGPAWGQAYPSKPIRIIPGNPGGGADLQMRIIRETLTSRLGQSVVYDSRTASVMGGIVARAEPDGYTLLAAGAGVWYRPIMGEADYDTLRDLAPITGIGTSPSILVVHPSVPVNSVKDLIAYAKSKPGALNYSSSGDGSSYHIAGELFKSMTGTEITRIPYTAAGPTIQAVMTGQVQMSFGTSASVSPFIKSGKLKALAHTGPKPSPLAPGLPDMAAAGLPGFLVTSTNALFAPAKTPSAIIQRLNRDMVWALTRPGVDEKFLSVGAEPMPTTPEQITAIVKTEYANVAKIMKAAGIKTN